MYHANASLLQASKLESNHSRLPFVVRVCPRVEGIPEPLPMMGVFGLTDMRGSNVEPQLLYRSILS